MSIGEPHKLIHTKFGNAVINQKGYYQISTVDKGHHNKLFHRVLFEDFYGEIPDGYIVHHKNGNKLDNCILNLELMKFGEHSRTHNSGENNLLYGKKASLDYKIATSKYRNTTGYFRVTKNKSNRYAQGFRWVYQFYDRWHDKRVSLSSVDLPTLKQKVISEGYEWIEFEEGVLDAN